MSTPWDTDTYYELGVTTTVVAGQPQLKLCNVILKYEGLNVPCIYPRDQLYITTTGGGPYDKFVWDLGRIRNAAQRWSTFCVIAVKFQYLYPGQAQCFCLGEHCPEDEFLFNGRRVQQRNAWLVY